MQFIEDLFKSDESEDMIIRELGLKGYRYPSL